jgi:hypothetical protein
MHGSSLTQDFDERILQYQIPRIRENLDSARSWSSLEDFLVVKETASAWTHTLGLHEFLSKYFTGWWLSLIALLRQRTDIL